MYLISYTHARTHTHTHTHTPAGEATDCGALRPVKEGEYLPHAEIDKMTRTTSVFARAKPEDKLEIVKSLQRQVYLRACVRVCVCVCAWCVCVRVCMRACVCVEFCVNHGTLWECNHIK